MTALLVSHRCNAAHGADLAAAAALANLKLELLVLPADPEARLADDDCARIDLAYFSEDVFPECSRQFFSALRKAPGLKWLHVFNAGVDHPIYAEMLARGVRLTTSSGSTAEPIAQTAITGLLMLARHFPHWLEAQRKHAGTRCACRMCRATSRARPCSSWDWEKSATKSRGSRRRWACRCIGVRRSAQAARRPGRRAAPAGRVGRTAARADWLIVACPLTAETRGMIDADLLARLPRGARIINIARGEIVDEAALVAALARGHLAGAYLDVFRKEPLPPASPLWDMPNVIISPHNSAAASGNDAARE